MHISSFVCSPQRTWMEGCRVPRVAGGIIEVGHHLDPASLGSATGFSNS
jgi:hypothetical protein